MLSTDAMTFASVGNIAGLGHFAQRFHRRSARPVHDSRSRITSEPSEETVAITRWSGGDRTAVDFARPLLI
jgi:hypothetical protein